MSKFYAKSTLSLSLSLSRNRPLNQNNKKRSSGFTLLEILLVVGIISILAGIVIVAINPSKQLATVRNAERKSDIKQINSALTQYYIDEFEYPGTITPTPTEICDTGATSSPSGVDCDGLIDLSILVPDYITAIPKDPKATGSSTGYSVLVSSGKIGLDATLAELEEDITLGIASGTGGGNSLGISGLVAHYKMNDADCTNVEDSAGNNDGEGTCTSVDGHVGLGALSFNGESDYIKISNSVSLQLSDNFTYSAWVKLDSVMLSSVGMIISRDAGNPSDLLWYLANGTPVIQSQYNFGVGADTAISDDGWHFIAIVKSASNYIFYLDGTPDGSFEDSNSINIDRDYYIGKDVENGNVLPYKGLIDDVRIYNRALEPEEITQLAEGTEAE